MTKPGRIACINPKCRCTAADDGTFTQIVCGKCRKTMPLRLVRRYRALRKLHRKYLRRREGGKASDRDIQRIEVMCHNTWNKYWLYFNRPEKPEGLDKFLEETGFNEVSAARNATDPRRTSRPGHCRKHT